MPRARTTRWLLTLALVICTAPAAASDEPGWPFLRGPRFDGHSAEVALLDAWPPEGPPVLWALDLGQGYSGFVAKDDRLYTQRQTLLGQSVICLDAWTGRTVWEYRYDLPFEPAGLYPGPRATPTLARGHVYFATPTGVLGCLTESGRLVWQVPLAEKFRMPDIGFGYACSPVVVNYVVNDAADDLVLMPVGGPGAGLVALRADTGETVWQAGDDRASYTPAYPITLQGRRLVIGYMENALVAHDLSSGERLWRLGLSHGYDEHSAWPIYSESHLWISGPFRAGSRLLELRDEEPRVTTVWKKPLMSNDVASSVLVDGHLYGFDLREAQVKVQRASRGQFRCLEFLTGQERWATAAVGHATALVADGKLILLNDTGDLILARVSPERYEELARCSILPGEIGWTAPALHRHRLFARNQSRAVCVYLGPREELNAQRPGDGPLRSVSDLPQDRARTWPELLGIEPSYTTDVPDSATLRLWFLVGLATLAVASVGSMAIVLLVVRALPPCRQADPARLTQWRDRLFRGTAIGLGLLGTTLLSRWRGEFVFTWMTTIFVLLDWVLSQSASPDGQTMPRWIKRSTDAVFVLGCLGYFEICRRLGLVTGWFFLVSLLAAIPILWIGYRWRCPTAAYWLLTDVIRATAFAAFFGGAVILVRWASETISHSTG